MPYPLPRPGSPSRPSAESPRPSAFAARIPSRLAAALLLVLVLTAGASAQTNPFTGRSAGGSGTQGGMETPAGAGSAAESSPGESSADADAPVPGGAPEKTAPDGGAEKAVPAPAAGRRPSPAGGTGFFYRLPYQQELIGIQRRLNSGLADFIRELRDAPSPRLLFLILGMSFLYGFIHALLPGHRKMILFGYFIAEDSRPLQGAAAGLGLAVLHAAASVIIIGGVYLVLKGAATISGSFENANAFIQSASAWLLLAAGAVLLVLKIRETAGGHGHDHGDRGPGPGGGDDNAGRAPSGNRRRMLPFIIFSGMIPCPGASMILMFSLSLGIFPVVLLSVAAMSAGMAVTLVSVSVLTILFKKRALRFFSGKHGRLFHAIVELGGAGFLFAFGLWLVVFMPPLG